MEKRTADLRAVLLAFGVIVTACEPGVRATHPGRAAQHEAAHPPPKRQAHPRHQAERVDPVKAWARAVLGHEEVGYTCQGMDSNDDGYDSCDLVDRRTGRVYPLSCPAAMAIFSGNFNTTCKLRLR